MKLGIVFEGGASRTLFSCGAIDALLENKVHADYIIGVSAGIAYGVGYASGQIGRNLTVATKYMRDPRYMGAKYLFDRHNRGYYNLDFVFEEIPAKLVPFDFDAYEKYDGRIIAGVTNIETGKAEYIDIPRDDRTFKVLRASCALPILFQPVEINGKRYMDGGITDSIPYKHALADGCDKLIVILTRERGYIKTTEAAIPISKRIFRKYPNFARALEDRSAMYNQTRKDLFELEKNGGAVVIMPQEAITCKRTEKSPEKLKELYDDGYHITKQMMPKILEYINK